MGWTSRPYSHRKHRVDLPSLDIRRIHSVPYRAVTKAREFERSEIDDMLKMNFIEPPQMEWALPVVFAAKKEL